MIITINQQTLEKYLPFAKDVRGSKIFASYAQPLDDADMVLKRNLLGVSTYNLLKTAFSTQTMPANEALSDTDCRIGCTLDDIKNVITKFLCNRAAYMNAGKNDLVQTTFGFGTVSGQQEAIASSARVEAMKAECRRNYEQAEDDLIKMLIGNSYTKDTAVQSWAWLQRTKYLVWTREEMREIFPIEEQIDSVDKYRQELSAASDALANVISQSQLSALVSAMRSSTVTESQDVLIGQCRNLLSALIRKDLRAIELIKIDIYVTLDKYSFAEWAASSECAARKVAPIENRQDSGAFFMI